MKRVDGCIPNRITLTIDGPAASGKSTVGGLVAEELSYLYFDTGVMYRAVTWAALERAVEIEDEAAVTQLAYDLRIEVEPPTVQDGRQYTVLADGEDVTWKIREPAVNRYVSPVSAYRGVRLALTAQQRRIGSRGGVVMVGRDIGTVVLPQAEVKIYLDASLQERAQRRLREVVQRGDVADLQGVIADLRRRDRIDSSRKEAPLRPAEDSVTIDSTFMTIEQVVARVLNLVRDALACHPPDET